MRIDTPNPVEIDYPVLLDAATPHLQAYPVETVVAEKFEAIVIRGIANSRLKDFYDLYLIAKTFELPSDTLAEAVRRTFERRGTDVPESVPAGLTADYAAAWGAQWRAFLMRERMAAVPDDLAAVLAELTTFLMPLARRAREPAGS